MGLPCNTTIGQSRVKGRLAALGRVARTYSEYKNFKHLGRHPIIWCLKGTDRSVGLRHGKKLFDFVVVSEDLAERIEKSLPGAVPRRETEHVDVCVGRVDPEGDGQRIGTNHHKKDGRGRGRVSAKKNDTRKTAVTKHETQH